MAPPPGRGEDPLLRGVDGCRGGWLAVCGGTSGPVLAVDLHPDAASLLAGSWHLTAVDMPIGLPGSRPRTCDLEARRLLGRRRSSLFPAPPRLTLQARCHAEACSLCRSEQGVGMSLQSFHLLPRIRDLDAELRADRARAARVVEVHPELAFCQWNGGSPLHHGKRTRQGRMERLALVEGLFPGAWQAIRRRFRRREVADDDILDALAALRSARRIHAGEALLLPGGAAVPRDACGLPMRIAV